jgi:hypothetical protein
MKFLLAAQERLNHIDSCDPLVDEHIAKPDN